MAVFFVEICQDVHFEGQWLEDAINEGVRQGYTAVSYTHLDVYKRQIETRVEGEIAERGVIALDAKIFSEIVRKLPDLSLIHIYILFYGISEIDPMLFQP